MRLFAYQTANNREGETDTSLRTPPVGAFVSEDTPQRLLAPPIINTIVWEKSSVEEGPE